MMHNVIARDARSSVIERKRDGDGDGQGFASDLRFFNSCGVTFQSGLDKAGGKFDSPKIFRYDLVKLFGFGGSVSLTY